MVGEGGRGRKREEEEEGGGRRREEEREEEKREEKKEVHHWVITLGEGVEYTHTFSAASTFSGGRLSMVSNNSSN